MATLKELHMDATVYGFNVPHLCSLLTAQEEDGRKWVPSKITFGKRGDYEIHTLELCDRSGSVLGWQTSARGLSEGNYPNRWYLLDDYRPYV